MLIKITIGKDNRAAIESPYNPTFVDRIKKMGGKWDAGRKVWTIDARNIEEVRAVMRDIYGMDDQPTELVSVRIRVTEKIEVSKGPVTMFGRVVASAFGRDSGARLGDGVAFVAGGATSGGSVKHWETVINSNSEIILHDVPRGAVESGSDVPDGVEYEIIETPANDHRAQLEEEKVRLLARLAEIQRELGENSTIVAGL